MSLRIQLRLASVLQSLAEGEQKTEVIRQVLAEQSSFEPYAAFCRLDLGKKGFILASDIQEFFQDNNLYVSHKEAIKLINELTTSLDRRLSYSNFAEAILPHEDRRLKQLANFRESYYLQDGEPLPYEAEWALARVLEQEIKNIRKTDGLKQSLQDLFDFNKLECFNCIDKKRLGYIDIQSIDEFMIQCNMTLNEDQLVALFRKIGSKSNITYSQFAEIITLNDFPSYKVKEYIPQQSINKSYSNYSNQKQNYLNSTFYTPSKSSKKKFEDELKDQQYYNYLQRSASLERLKNSMKYSRSQRYQSPLRYSSQSKRVNVQSRLQYNTDKQYKQHLFSSQLKCQQSPLKQHEEEQLVKALKQQVLIDKDVEELKNQIALRSDFKIEDAFRIIDQKGNGYVSKLEFEVALNDIGIFPTKNELYLFFQRYDKDNDGLLQYSDFNDLITPANSEYAYLFKRREPLYCDPENGLFNFSVETRRLFQKLMNKILQSEVEAELIRQQLNRRPFFSIQNAFQAIDSLDSGFITLQDFKQILNEYGIFATRDDLNNLVKRYDKNEDSKVTYREFVKELLPKSPVKYAQY
ncbi:hypothetical protein IMG5_117610 [Ichthyophthirius multifiliis]|uniref:EF-hand domain-containing protein n=1 Tax=Ichthyophthirius multifiliis TaxID=5932 RepID=G0QUJ8_ICHMU|nr:hypothetical protein IMG5_117610 [Ichthyophthirius multifiliis]EGR31118.1 hypothetical protein IMG5_117610 [Ichthyophthirius multifiliis]|eukprot:XP_004034604.1 hypothetical protein IMG5_117610 [Ichthyophthirius multifiliis]